MAQIKIPLPASVGFSFDSEQPTRNTEELSRYFLGLFTAANEAGLVLDDGQITSESEEEYIFDSIWNAQSSLITQQQGRFNAVAGMLRKKADALPEESALTSLLDELIDQGLEALKIWFIAKLTASAIGAMAGGLVIPLTIAGITYLRETYLTGEKLLKGINAMMDSVVGGDMPRTKENFDMRANLIDQNERQLANYLQEMLAAESQAGGGGGASLNGLDRLNEEFEKLNVTMDLIQAEDNVVQCPHSGDENCFIYTKSLVLDRYGDT